MGDESAELLRRYLEGVVRRAEHSRRSFPEVAGHVLVEVLLRHDGGSLGCRVPAPSSELPVELHFTMRQSAYVLAYTHAEGGRLELRDGGGAVVVSFRNSETLAWVKAAFNRL